MDEGEVCASLTHAESNRSATLVAIETDESLAGNNEIQNTTKDKEARVSESDVSEALSLIVMMNNDKEDEIIEVDVELEGDCPPPELFLTENEHLGDGDQYFSSISVNQDHLRGEMAESDNFDVFCGKCGKRFSNINNLQCHLKLHPKIKNFFKFPASNLIAKSGNMIQNSNCEQFIVECAEKSEHRSIHTVDENDCKSQQKKVPIKSEINDGGSFLFRGKDELISSDICVAACSDIDSLKRRIDLHTNGPESENLLENQQLSVKKASSALKDVLPRKKSFPGPKMSSLSAESPVNDIKNDEDDNLSVDDVTDYDNMDLFEVESDTEEKPLIIQIIKESKCCKECGETFSDSTQSRQHELTHAQDKSHACQECGEQFQTFFSMLGHMRMHHINGDTDLLVCKKCSKCFQTLEELNGHAEEHSKKNGRRQYACSVCSKSFTHKHSLKNHMPLHYGMGEHQCQHCEKLFPCASSLNRHVKIHSTSKLYFCDECDKGFKDSYALKKHTRIHSSERPYVCQECGSSFRTQSTLSAHTVVHTKIKPFPCQECGKRFSFRSDLNRHMKLHSGVRPHQCDICSKAFFEKSRLIIHRRTHTGEKPFKCSECGESFISTRNLARHMKNHNPTFICTVCSKTYVDAYTLKIHMYKHTGERPHACEQCPKRFRTPALLKKHELTHTGVKPFICDECGRGFTSALNLKNHKTLHTGDRPFQCPECDKCFPTESTLKVHMQFHGEKAYFCEQCGRSFHRVYELKLHEITHASQKPYSCEFCSKSFCHKATYKAHMNTHTEEMKYPCPECGKIFLRSNTLRKHIKTHLKAHQRVLPADGAGSFKPSEYFEEAYLCTECGNTYPEMETLKQHLIETHGGWKDNDDETELVVEEIPVAENATSIAGQ